NVIVHQHKIAARTIDLVDGVHEVGERSRVALGTFKLWYSAEVTLADAAPRSVGEISVPYRVPIVDLIKDAVIGDKVLDGRSGRIVRVEVSVKLIELQGACRSLVKQSANEPNPAPSRLAEEPSVHQRCGDAPDKNTLRFTVRGIEREIDRF